MELVLTPTSGSLHRRSQHPHGAHHNQRPSAPNTHFTRCGDAHPLHPLPKIPSRSARRLNGSGLLQPPVARAGRAREGNNLTLFCTLVACTYSPGHSARMHPYTYIYKTDPRVEPHPPRVIGPMTFRRPRLRAPHTVRARGSTARGSSYPRRHTWSRPPGASRRASGPPCRPRKRPWQHQHSSRAPAEHLAHWVSCR